MSTSDASKQDDNNNNNNENENLEVEKQCCPICMHSKTDNDSIVFVYSDACGHEYCQLCMDQLLLLGPSQSVPPNANTSSSSFATPTFGSCPMCRADLSYFDLLLSRTKERLIRDDEDTALDPWLDGAIFGTTSNADDGKGGIGWGSLHFPSPNKSRSTTTSDDDDKITHERFRAAAAAVPYMDNSEIPSELVSSQSSRRVIHFTKVSRYHAHTHTWEGQAITTEPLDDDDDDKREKHRHFRIVLTFSDNFQHIVRGFMLFTVWISNCEDNSDNLACSDRASPTSLFHFDGRWLVQPWNGDDTPVNNASSTTASAETVSSEAVDTPSWSLSPSRTIHVQQSLVQENNVWHRLMRQDGSIRLQPTDLNLPVMVAEWDWNGQPGGPIVPDTHLVWRTRANEEGSKKSRNRPVMEWIRQSTVPTSPSKGVTNSVPMGRDSDQMYRRLDIGATKSTRRPWYRSDTVWGNTFCQGYTVGLASYHFVRTVDQENEGMAYISYEHGKVAKWPALDDGRPIPCRVQFRNISFPDPHTFRGHICWLEDFGTTWQNSTRWEYEMKFDTQFMCIVSGTVRCAKTASNSESTESLEEMSRYGDTLLYCNAGLHEAFTQQLYGSSLNIVQLKKRLCDEEGASEELSSIIKGLAMAATLDFMANEETNNDPIDIDMT